MCFLSFFLSYRYTHIHTYTQHTTLSFVREHARWYEGTMRFVKFMRCVLERTNERKDGRKNEPSGTGACFEIKVKKKGG